MGSPLSLTLDDKLSMLIHRGFDRQEALAIVGQHLKDNTFDTGLDTLSRALVVGKAFDNDGHWKGYIPLEDFKLVQILDKVEGRDGKGLYDQTGRPTSLLQEARAGYTGFRENHPQAIKNAKIAAGIALVLCAQVISGCGNPQQNNGDSSIDAEAPPEAHFPAQLLPPGGDWKTYQLPGIGLDGITSEENQALGLFSLVDTPSRRKMEGEYQYFIEQYVVNGKGTDHFRFKLSHWDKTKGIEVFEFEPLNRETVERLEQKLREEEKNPIPEQPGAIGEKKEDGQSTRQQGNLRDEVFNHGDVKPGEADKTNREVLAPHIYRESLFNDPGIILKVSGAINEFPYDFSPLERQISYEKALNPGLPEQRIRNYFGNLSNKVAHALIGISGKATLDDAVIELKKTRDGKIAIIRTIAESLIRQNWVYRPVEKLGDSFNPGHVRDNYVYSDCNTCLQDAYLEVARNLGLPLFFVCAPNHAYGLWKDKFHSIEVEATASRAKKYREETDQEGNTKVVELHQDVPDYDRLTSALGTHHSDSRLTSRGEKRVQTGAWFSPVTESPHLDEIIRLSLNSDRLEKFYRQLEENPMVIAEIMKITDGDSKVGYRSTNPWVIDNVHERLKAAIEASLEVGAPILARKATDFLEKYLKKHNVSFMEDENNIPLLRRRIYSLENPRDLAAKLNTVDERIYDGRGLRETLEEKKKDYQARYNAAARANNFTPFLEFLVQETGESAAWVPLAGVMGQYLQNNNPREADELAEKGRKKITEIVQGIADEADKHDEGTPENDVASYVANNIVNMLLGKRFRSALRTGPWEDLGIPQEEWAAYNKIYRQYEDFQQTAYNLSRLLVSELKVKFQGQE
ncbi:hypothetical protein HYV84_00120 [Candidatus Woesearchaeota archaeon]|nr:hypothetical protein [Candidatus Woesearchaeota archaeon]